MVEQASAVLSFTTGTQPSKPVELTFTLKAVPTPDFSALKFDLVTFEYEYHVTEDGNLVVTEKQSLWKWKNKRAEKALSLSIESRFLPLRPFPLPDSGVFILPFQDPSPYISGKHRASGMRNK